MVCRHLFDNIINILTILREAKDPAQAYLNPQPSIAAHEDITRLLEAYLRRFTARAQGGLPSCEIGYEQR